MATVAPTVPLSYPPTAPSWVVKTLQTLAAKGKLSGVPPQVLAGFARTESDYGNQGLGVNSSGYGGYFGLDAAQRAQSGGTTPGLETFEEQAQVAAGDIANELKATGGTWHETIQAISGGTNDWNYQLSTIFGGRTPGKANTATLTGYPSILTGPGAIITGGKAAIGGALTGWESTVKEWLIRGGLMAFGAILILVAIKGLLDQGKTELERAPGESVTAAAESQGGHESTAAEGAEAAVA